MIWTKKKHLNLKVPSLHFNKKKIHFGNSFCDLVLNFLEFFDAEEHWESFDDDDDEENGNQPSSAASRAKKHRNTHSNHHHTKKEKSTTKSPGKPGSDDSTSDEDGESDKEFFNDLSPEGLRQKKKVELF